MAKTITVREAIAAIRKNGLPKLKRQYYSINRNEEVTGGCAIGQGAINLGVAPDILESELNSALGLKGNPIPALNGVAYSTIHGLNDHTQLSLPAIADLLEKQAESFDVMDKELVVPEMEYKVAPVPS